VIQRPVLIKRPVRHAVDALSANGGIAGSRQRDPDAVGYISGYGFRARHRRH
jgi:hypothetical protein